MARLEFPLVDVLIGVPATGPASGRAALLTHGVEIVLYADEACTVPLDATTLDGEPITSVYVDGVTIPPFRGPDDGTVYVWGLVGEDASTAFVLATRDLAAVAASAGAEGATAAVTQLDSVRMAEVAADASSTFATSVLSSLSKRDTYNPLRGDHPLGARNAIGDGATHPLSTRFASLAAAQAIFPRATSLSEEIDESALQWGLDNYAAVTVPAGFTFMFSGLTTVYTSAADTARGLGEQAFLCAGVLKLRDGATSRTMIASGNFRTSTIGAPRVAADVPLMKSLTVHVREIDGNKANTVAGATANLPAIGLMHIDGGDFDWWVHDFRGQGSSVWGVLDGYTTNITTRRIRATRCTGQYAIQFSNRVRKITYPDVLADYNDNDGFFWDHSEGTSSSARGVGNGGYGILLRNVANNDAKGLWAYDNGFRGILVSGNDNCKVDAQAFDNGWRQDANGLVGGLPTCDVYFDAMDGSHGVTYNSRFNLTVGGQGLSTNSTPKTAKYGVYMEDGITGPNVIEVNQLRNNVTSNYRLPADPGKLRLLYSPTNESLPTVVRSGSSSGGGSTGLAPGGRYGPIRKTVNQTITSNATTFVTIDELVFDVYNGESYVAEFDLVVQSAANAGIVIRALYPTPAPLGRFELIGISDPDPTTGLVQPRRLVGGLTSEYSVGTTSNPATSITARISLTLGAISAPPKPLGLQYKQLTSRTTDTIIVASSRARIERTVN